MVRGPLVVEQPGDFRVEGNNNRVTFGGWVTKIGSTYVAPGGNLAIVGW